MQVIVVTHWAFQWFTFIAMNVNHWSATPLEGDGDAQVQAVERLSDTQAPRSWCRRGKRIRRTVGDRYNL